MNESLLESLAGRLRIARTAAGLDQRTAAKKLGIAQGTLSNYERAKTDASFQMVCDMADLYGVSLDWLGGRSEKMQG